MLPTTKTAIVSDFEHMVWLLYGPPKIGKSTFASDFEDPIFATTEHAHRHLSIYNRPIEDWNDFKVFTKELSATKRFKTIVIDTVPLLYMMCSDHVCLKKGLEHPGDEGFGRGYDAVNQEFAREIMKLQLTKRGLVFLCHYKQVEIKGRGIKYTKTAPKLPGGCWGVIGPMVDIIAYAGFDTLTMTKRVLVTEPREDLEAGFRTPRAIKNPLPGTLPLSYAAVKEAWNKTAASAKNAGVIRRPVSSSSTVRRIITK